MSTSTVDVAVPAPTGVREIIDLTDTVDRCVALTHELKTLPSLSLKRKLSDISETEDDEAEEGAAIKKHKTDESTPVDFAPKEDTTSGIVETKTEEKTKRKFVYHSDWPTLVIVVTEGAGDSRTYELAPGVLSEAKARQLFEEPESTELGNEVFDFCFDHAKLLKITEHPAAINQVFSMPCNVVFLGTWA